MVPSIARQSVILKCNMQKSVMLGNYEFYYAAGLLKKLYGLPLSPDMEPAALQEAILSQKDRLQPQSAEERYLLQLLENYEPLDERDADMEKLFFWGEAEPDLWKVTTDFEPTYAAADSSIGKDVEKRWEN